MKTVNWQGVWALITGASSGLGVDFARQLAAEGCNLILVARREERLNAVKTEIMATHHVDVEVIVMDLGVDEAGQQLYDRVAALGKQVDILVNNAGFGVYGDFIDVPWEREKAMLTLDIMTLVQLTKLYAREMAARNAGYILLVSSIGGYQPSPTYASYSAAKSYVLNFGEALNYELRKQGVHVSVLAPGVTATEFLQVSGQEKTLYQRMVMMKSKDVVRAGIDGLRKNKPSVLPGFMNKLAIFSLRLTPRRWWAAIAYQTMKT